MNTQFDVSPEDLKVFLEEADELLQGMEESILRLEQQPDDAECLRALFRQAHTLKGSAATLGHQDMARVAHAMESSLDELRQGRGAVSAEFVNALLFGLDALKLCRQGMTQGAGRPVDVAAVAARLDALSGAGGSAGPAAPAAGEPPALSEEDVGAIQAAAASGLAAWWVTVPVERAAPMRSLRAYQVVLRLQHAGVIIRSWPAVAELEQDQLGAAVRILLTSHLPEEEIRAAAGSVPETGPVELARAAATSRAKPGAALLPPEGLEGQATANGRTVRVDVEVLDTLMNLVGELVIDRTRLVQVLGALGETGSNSEAYRELAAASAHIGRVTGDLQDQVMRARMVPVENLFRKFPRMVRDVAQVLGKEVDLVVSGEETELDRAVMEEIADPIMHLLRNALDHGIETPQDRLLAQKPPRGTLHLTARHEEDRIVIAVRDDGRGLNAAEIRKAAVRKGVVSEEMARRLSDQETVNLIFAPGFSTKEQVTDVSGRGVGMDVVKQNLDKLNGAVEVWTEAGKGTEFRLKIPLTLAILRGLLVEMLGEVVALPLTSVVEIIDLSGHQVRMVRGQQVVTFRGQVVPVLTPHEAFGLPGSHRRGDNPDRQVVVLVQAFGRQMGLMVDGLMGEQEIVVKPLGKFVGEVPGISGATILGNGHVALILDVPRLVGALGQQRASA